MAATEGLTAALARFTTRARDLPLDDAVRSTVRTGFIDSIATLLAGRDEPLVGVLKNYVAARGRPADEARALFGARVSARDAALINGAAGHALDYDDVALRGHPSTVLVPAVLAEGERLKASGEAVMRAYVVGYETWAELVGRDAGMHHLKGWHPTGVFGTVGAAAAVCALRGLDAGRARHALGIAASLASGLVANFGSMTKPFHAGHAAAAGIEAVDLAELGMTAAPDALEHHAGYLAALSPAGEVDRTSPALAGTTLRIRESGLSIKKYPLCFATHRSVDAVIDLAQKHDIRPDRVRAVAATIGVAQASMLRNHAPRDSLAAKFSLEFAVAAALVARKVGLAELDDAFVNRADVQALFGKLVIATTDTRSPVEASMSAADRVVITLEDGRVLDSGEVPFARGDAFLPLREGELEAKFRDCTAQVRDIDTARLLARLKQLDGVADVRSLGT